MTLRDDNGPLYTVQYLKGRLHGALSDLEQVEMDTKMLTAKCEQLQEPDPTVPHGYPSWKDYAEALKAGKESAEGYIGRLNILINEYCEEIGKLRTDRSNMRRELRRLNASVRALKLECEVLKGRNRQQEKTLKVALSEPVIRGPEWFAARAERSSVEQNWVDPGLPKDTGCMVCHNPQCEEPGGKH